MAKKATKSKQQTKQPGGTKPAAGSVAKAAETIKTTKSPKIAKSTNPNQTKITVTELKEAPAKRRDDRKADAKAARKAAKAAQKAAKNTNKPAKSDKKPFILARPFLALGRYFKGSFTELRQTRFPNRRATWKMTLMVILYTAVFLLLITLLDLLFTFIFNNLLG